MFSVGQKVVCIRLFNNPFLSLETRQLLRFPVVGTQYAVRGVGDCCVKREIQSGIYLQEILNPPYETAIFGFREPMFRACDFRPIVERKTDISELKALLLPNAKILEGV